MARRPTAPPSSLYVDIFETSFGYTAIWGADQVLHGLVFGLRTSAAAHTAAEKKAAQSKAASRLIHKQWHTALAERLIAYANGAADDFADIELDLKHLTPFSARVIRHCRQIAYGETSSYGRLATAAGSPGAARAVGTVMSSNRYPVVIPCHRVLNSNGSLGNYSGPDGMRMKARLLEMEQKAVGLLL